MRMEDPWRKWLSHPESLSSVLFTSDLIIVFTQQLQGCFSCVLISTFIKCFSLKKPSTFHSFLRPQLMKGDMLFCTKTLQPMIRTNFSAMLEYVLPPLQGRLFHQCVSVFQPSMDTSLETSQSLRCVLVNQCPGTSMGWGTRQTSIPSIFMATHSSAEGIGLMSSTCSQPPS